LGFAFYLHGIKIINLIVVLNINYLLTKNLKIGALFTLVIWVFCCVIKGYSEIYHGFSLKYFNINADESCIVEWYSTFGLIMLRMISFSMEYKITKDNKSISSETSTSIYKNQEKYNPCTECQVQNYCQRYLLYAELTIQNFNFGNYLIYIFYPPLYLTGPIITYNSFIFQLDSSIGKTSFSRECYSYLIRTFVIFIIFEVFNHTIYPNAILTNPYNKWIAPELDDFTFKTMCIFVLLFLYLKFSLIWKTGRLFALLDDINTEENMNRCILNQCCFEDFWRDWHKSFNQWIIKYIFIPLGGRKYKAYNIWIIFTFVALWHDLDLKLLVWGWSICIVLIPEMIAKKISSGEGFLKLKAHFWFRYLIYLAPGMCMVCLCFSNLVGFGMGHSNLIEIIIHSIKTYPKINWLYCVIFFAINSIQMLERDKKIRKFE